MDKNNQLTENEQYRYTISDLLSLKHFRIDRLISCFLFVS
jgi:hypothetical protein